MPLWLQRLVAIYIISQALGGFAGFFLVVYLIAQGMA